MREAIPDHLRLARGAEHLHACGPRTVAEFLIEFATRHGCLDQLLDTLDAWRRLDPTLVSAVINAACAGRHFPAVLAVLEGATRG